MIASTPQRNANVSHPENPARVVLENPTWRLSCTVHKRGRYVPYDHNASAEDCRRSWGVTPTEAWARIGLGGKRILDASHVLFSNGALDPWSGGGVLHNLTSSLRAVVIASGAHHIDLMFTDPADPADVTDARNQELHILKAWVNEAEARRRRSITGHGSVEQA